MLSSLKLVAGIVTCGFLLTAPSLEAAQACSCLQPIATPEEGLQRQDIAFWGRVIAIDLIRQRSKWDTSRLEYMLSVRFAVRHVYKGAISGKTVELLTGLTDADCGYPFRMGTDYAVFAFINKDSSLYTGLCTATTRSSRKIHKRIMAALGK